MCKIFKRLHEYRHHQNDENRREYKHHHREQYFDRRFVGQLFRPDEAFVAEHIALYFQKIADAYAEFLRLDNCVQDGSKVGLFDPDGQIAQCRLPFFAQLNFFKSSAQFFAQCIHFPAVEDIPQRSQKVFAGLDGQRQEVENVRQVFHDFQMSFFDDGFQPCSGIDVQTD